MALKKGQFPTQADKRRNGILKDQHGRSWFASIERESGFPTGLMQPQFATPHPELIPHQKYMVFNEDEPNRFQINYGEWLADLGERSRDWSREHHRLINFLPGGASNPMLAEMLGPRPMNPKVVQAMQQGNRWVLGLPGPDGHPAPKPKEAEAYFPTIEEANQETVFTETAPVFTEDDGQVESSPTMNLSQLLEEVSARCPKNLTGGARGNWISKELARMAVEESAHAGS